MKATIFIYLILTIGPILLVTEDKNTSEQLLGYWVVAERQGEITTYEQSKRFLKNKPGFQFLEDGTMLRRQNVGWCGTPPITYTNSPGKWTINDQGLLEMDYKFWGGQIKETWEILSLEQAELQVVSKKFETIRE